MRRTSTPSTSRPPAPEQGVPRLVTTAAGRELFCQELHAAADGPTVVFEAGMGATRSLWVLVQQALGVVHSVAYDRSGMGRSPETNAPKRLLNLADDLNGLLDALDSGPYILVGHSWGGPIIRAAAATHPDRVAAMVLVDPADEDCDLYYGRALRVMDRVQAALLPPLSRTGLLGALYVRSVRRLPAAVRADLRSEMYTPAAVRSLVASNAHLPDDLRAMQRSHVDPVTLPTTVISGTRADIGGKGRASLIQAHRNRVAGFDDGRHVLAPESGHLVMLDAPELVAREIDRRIRD